MEAVIRDRRDEVAKLLARYTPTRQITRALSEKYKVSTRTIDEDIAVVREEWSKKRCTSLEKRLEQALQFREELIAEAMKIGTHQERATALRAADSLAHLQGLTVERSTPAEFKFNFGGQSFTATPTAEPDGEPSGN